MPSVIKADDYYASYYLYTKNFKIVNERLRLSKAMVTFKKDAKPICTILSNSKKIKSFLKQNRKDILSCLFNEGVFVSSYGTYEELISKKEIVVLKIPPTPIQVIFNNGLVTIKKVKD